MKMPVGRLHVITDVVVQHRYSHAEIAELAIVGGADTIQFRSKATDVRELLREAGAAREVCRAHNVTFLVNDRVDVALAVDADGVHLGRGDMPLPVARRILGRGKIIGGTIRGVEHLFEAESDSADYVGLGPVFLSSSKDVGIAPLGVDVVGAVAKCSTLPVIAIAGITVENVRMVMDAGAYGVAVIGAISAADDVAAATARFCRLINK